jgi:hypothetical protein
MLTGVASFAGELGVVGAQLRVLAQHNLKVHADRYKLLVIDSISALAAVCADSIH